MSLTGPVLIAALSVALVAGCNRGVSTNAAAGNAADSAATAANTTAPAPTTQTPPSAPGGSGLDQAFMVGHWGADGNCTRTISLNADGSAVTSGDNEAGRWQLDGATLVVQGPGDEPQRIPVARNGDTLILSGPTGQQAALTRCPAAAATATPGADAPAPGAYQDEKSD